MNRERQITCQKILISQCLNPGKEVTGNCHEVLTTKTHLTHPCHHQRYFLLLLPPLILLFTSSLVTFPFNVLPFLIIYLTLMLPPGSCPLIVSLWDSIWDCCGVLEECLCCFSSSPISSLCSGSLSGFVSTSLFPCVYKMEKVPIDQLFFITWEIP